MNADAIGRFADTDLYIQEKIVLVLDKDGYVAGDTIRFRAFLLDAASERQLKDFSQYIYVELIDPLGATVDRVKIKSKDGAFIGIIPLNPELPESVYTISAYTLFSQNIPSGYFYRLPIPVASQYSSKYKMENFVADGSLTIRLTSRLSGEPVKCRRILISGPEGEVVREAKDKSHLSIKMPKGMPAIKLTFDNYHKIVALPGGDNGPMLDFYPEGGSLIAGEGNAVAFKSSDSFGRPTAVTGHIEGPDGSVTAKLKSDRCGLGIFHIVPREGCEYHAVVNGRRFQLPAVLSDGTSLKIVASNKGRIIVDVIGRHPRPGILYVDLRGHTQVMDTVSKFPVIISGTDLGHGLLRFTLLDEQRRHLSTRFVYNHAEWTTSIHWPDSLPPSGDFTIFTRDDNNVPSGIQSALLQQDLSGYVDGIDSYFSESGLKKEMDALMLTVNSDRYTNPSFDHPIEMGFEISGTIKSRWRGKPMSDAKINIIAPSIGFVREARTDTSGRFVVDGFDWPDGTAFVCQAVGSNGSLEHNFNITQDLFPTISPIPLRYDREEGEPFDEYLNRLGEGGILLREVEVTAQANEADARAIIFSAMGIKSLDEDYLNENKVTSYDEALHAFPSLRVKDGRLVSQRGGSSIYGNEPEVEIWVDGVLWTASFLSPADDRNGHNDRKPKKQGMQQGQLSDRATKTAMIMTGGLLPEDLAQRHYSSQLSVISELSGSYPFNTVKSIEYVPPHSALVISNTAAHGGGALVITTKSGGCNDWSADLFLQVHRPLGYQSEKSALAVRRSDNGCWMPMADVFERIPTDGKSPVWISGFTPDGEFVVGRIR